MDGSPTCCSVLERPLAAAQGLRCPEAAAGGSHTRLQTVQCRQAGRHTSEQADSRPLGMQILAGGSNRMPAMRPHKQTEGSKRKRAQSTTRVRRVLFILNSISCCTCHALKAKLTGKKPKKFQPHSLTLHGGEGRRLHHLCCIGAQVPSWKRHRRIHCCQAHDSSHAPAAWRAP
jgi:hypothetical protein